MSRKHHTKHQRSRSRYPDRLRARGATATTVRMPFIDRWGRKHDTPDQLARAEGKRPRDEEVSSG